MVSYTCETFHLSNGGTDNHCMLQMPESQLQPMNAAGNVATERIRTQEMRFLKLWVGCGWTYRPTELRNGLKWDFHQHLNRLLLSSWVNLRCKEPAFTAKKMIGWKKKPQEAPHLGKCLGCYWHSTIPFSWHRRTQHRHNTGTGMEASSPGISNVQTQPFLSLKTGCF